MYNFKENIILNKLSVQRAGKRGEGVTHFTQAQPFPIDQRHFSSFKIKLAMVFK